MNNIVSRRFPFSISVANSTAGQPYSRGCRKRRRREIEKLRFQPRTRYEYVRCAQILLHPPPSIILPLTPLQLYLQSCCCSRGFDIKLNESSFSSFGFKFFAVRRRRQKQITLRCQYGRQPLRLYAQSGKEEAEEEQYNLLTLIISFFAISLFPPINSRSVYV